MPFRRSYFAIRIGNPIRANHHLLTFHNLFYISIQSPRQQYNLRVPVYHRQQPSVNMPIHIFSHPLVMLVYHHFMPKKFAQQYKRSILQKAHSMASDGKIAQVVLARSQQPKRLGISPDEPHRLACIQRPRPFVNLLHRARSGKIHKVHLKLIVQHATLLDALAHHRRAMYWRRHGTNKQNLCIIFQHNT